MIINKSAVALPRANIIRYNIHPRNVLLSGNDNY